MAKSTTTKSPAMEKLTESVGELKVFQLGTKEQQTPDKGTKQRHGGNKRSSPKKSKRVSLKSPNLDGRNSRRTTRANDQKMAKKARHKKNRTPVKQDKNVEDKKKKSREEVVDFSEVDAVVLQMDILLLTSQTINKC